MRGMRRCQDVTRAPPDREPPSMAPDRLVLGCLRPGDRPDTSTGTLVIARRWRDRRGSGRSSRRTRSATAAGQCLAADTRPTVADGVVRVPVKPPGRLRLAPTHATRGAGRPRRFTLKRATAAGPRTRPGPALPADRSSAQPRHRGPVCGRRSLCRTKVCGRTASPDGEPRVRRSGDRGPGSAT